MINAFNASLRYGSVVGYGSIGAFCHKDLI